MQEELLEALIGQRKRLEIEQDELREELARVKGENKEKISKSIKEIDTKIRQLNARISDLKSPDGKNIGVIPPYV
jgi:phage shock protein A